MYPASPSHPRAVLGLLAGLLLPGCLVTDQMLLAYIDSDHDGFYEVGFRGNSAWVDGTDCDDDDPAINPEQPELCGDGVDNDCDGAVDEDGIGDLAVFADLDGDGFGDPARGSTRCVPNADWVTDGHDCNDQNETIHPDARELCNGVDDDCDQLVDDGAPETPWYRDADGDSFGTSQVSESACAPPDGYVPTATDCDDDDPRVHPGVDDAPYDGIDADCARDGDYDVDGDGFLHPSSGTAVPDCDDADASIHPTAPERWYDGVDQDCDPLTEWDQDRDGFPQDTDCDDLNPLIRPGAPEVWYDGIDQDCDPGTEWDQDGDGLTPPGAPAGSGDDCDDQAAGVRGPTPWYADRDGDTWGDATLSLVDCYPPPNTADRAGDCNDLVEAVHPGATEVCSPWDEDCDGLIDEGAGPFWYPDTDGDSHGDETYEGLQSCQAPPSRWVRSHDDCDDLDGEIWPGAEEVCDLRDNDCDGFIDVRAGQDLREPHWRDQDRDGWGAGARTLACDAPGDDLAPQTGDCNDLRADIFPGAPEVCDGVDSNCADGIDDEDRISYWPDGDRDRYGDDGFPPDLLCRGARDGNPAWVDRGGDCDDDDPLISPAAREICDTLDNDCDGTIDVDRGLDLRTEHWPDLDDDGYGASSGALLACDLPHDGLARNDDDCDDASAAVHPGATEVCDGVDSNCARGIDDEDRVAMWPDEDQDGWGDASATPELACRGAHDGDPRWASRGGDCDDADLAVNPSAIEVCDEADNDCDGTVDLDHGRDMREPHWPDADGDGHGAIAGSQLACDVPDDALVRSSDDCDDADPTRYPGAEEVCDNHDNNCALGVDDEDQRTYWRDLDRDGYGDAATEQRACASPGLAWLRRGGDCDDRAPAIHPNAEELCDDVDNDCDGTIDLDHGRDLREALWLDVDGDGHGAPGQSRTTCFGPGLSRTADDCDDHDAARHPGAAEICDNVDNNCRSGIRDEGQAAFWLDNDGDGWGDDARRTQGCQPPPGPYVGQGGDCDDTRRSDHPTALERCDYRDNDCDGLVDIDRYGRRLQQPHYQDADGDGYGSASIGDACPVDGDALSTTAGDCQDGDPSIHPNAADDTCDWIDQDCEDGPDNFLCGYGYPDGDGDRHGDESADPEYVLRTQMCRAVGPGVPCYAEDADDCDDSYAGTYPGAQEICDGRENNCGPDDMIDRFGNSNPNDDFEGVDLEIIRSDVCGTRWYNLMGTIYLRGDYPQSWDQAANFCHSRGYKLWWPEDDDGWIFAEPVTLLANDVISGQDGLGSALTMPDTSYHTGVVNPCVIRSTNDDSNEFEGFYYYDGRDTLGHSPSCSPVPGYLLARWSLNTVAVQTNELKYNIHIQINPYMYIISQSLLDLSSYPICELE
ncbi:MAG TPA: putative metal-binding motif-containing protein [Myxococcota bacterium]|nr:putative metal-binding motif-containing protein [Myxococcota bacterium]